MEIKKVLSNKYLFNLFVKVASLAMSIISGALFTRYLGASLKGELASLESVALVASVVMNFGIYHLYPQMIKEKVEHAREKFVNIIFFLSLVYIVIVLIAFIATRENAVLYYGSMSIVSCFTAQITMIGMVEFPIYRSKIDFIISILNALMSVIVFVIGIKQMLLVPVLVYIVKNILFCTLILIRLKVKPNIFGIEPVFLVKLIKLGFVPMVTALLLKLNYKVDVIMLGIFHISNSDIGIYAVAVSVASQLWIIPEAFKEVLYSSATEKNAVKSFVMSLKVSNYSLVLIDICVLIFGRLAINILYGQEFADSYLNLVILIIGVPFMGVFNIVNPYYLSLGKYSIHLKNLALGVFSNIIVNAMLITSWHSIGAAIATTVSQIVCGIYACYQFCKSSGTPIKDILLINADDIKMVRKMVKR
ncbi:MAG: polysaccharide biosynthesis C-terminal domain-containing protein [Lachnospiraceae bacterium]|nr:polysaccharide biosynthesis C-terminal domain-containing protein [Lachnospiraceae bacterium]